MIPGILASSGVAASVPIVRRNGAGGGAGPTTSFTVTPAATALASSTHILVVGWSKGSTGDPTLTPSGSGWVLLGGFASDQATLNSGAWVWARPTVGGETSYTITSSASITLQWAVEEWTGIDNTALPLNPTAPFTCSATTSTSSQAINTNSVSVTAGRLLWSFLAGRGPSSGVISPDTDGNYGVFSTSGRAAFAYTANRIAGGSSTLPETWYYTNTQGSANTVRGAFAFKPANP